MTKHRPSKLQRFVKWAGVVVCVMIAAAWIANFFVAIYADVAVSETGQSQFRGHSITTYKVLCLRLRYGAMRCGFSQSTPVLSGIDEESLVQQKATKIGSSSRESFIPYEPGLRAFLATPSIHAGWVIMPFWLLLLLFAATTLLLFYRDRQQYKAGCCAKCGYDLAGNVSGVCSECGITTGSQMDAISTK